MMHKEAIKEPQDELERIIKHRIEIKQSQLDALYVSARRIEEEMHQVREQLGYWLEKLELVQKENENSSQK